MKSYAVKIRGLIFSVKRKVEQMRKEMMKYHPGGQGRKLIG